MEINLPQSTNLYQVPPEGINHYILYVDPELKTPLSFWIALNKENDNKELNILITILEI